MASVLQINTLNILSVAPTWMGEGGTYIPHTPAVVRQNGLGLDITAGYASVEWSWEVLSVNDMGFWYSTMLLGQSSFTYSQAKLYNHLGVLTTYTNCTVHMPSFSKIIGDLYYDCHILLDQLI